MKKKNVIEKARNMALDFNQETNCFISTGFRELDTILGKGIRYDDLILVSARPCMGKTSFVLNICHNIIHKYGKKVCYISLGESKKSIIDKLICSSGKVDQDSLHKYIVGENYNLFIKKFIKDIPLYFIIENKMELNALLDIIKFIDTDLLVVDSLSYIINKNNRVLNNCRISDILFELNIIAKEKAIPVIVVSNLKRTVEDRNSHFPLIIDLPGSDYVEDFADIILLIHRERYYNYNAKNTAIINIVKNKHGNKYDIGLCFDQKHFKFNEEGKVSD